MQSSCIVQHLWQLPCSGTRWKGHSALYIYLLPGVLCVIFVLALVFVVVLTLICLFVTERNYSMFFLFTCGLTVICWFDLSLCLCYFCVDIWFTYIAYVCTAKSGMQCVSSSVSESWVCTGNTGMYIDVWLGVHKSCCQITVVTTFCMVASNIYSSLVWKLFRVSLFWWLEFWGGF